MADEHKRRQELERAQEASRILDAPLMTSAVEGVRASLIAVMTERKTLDEDVLAAKRELLALETVLAKLRRHIQTGALAEAELNG